MNLSFTQQASADSATAARVLDELKLLSVERLSPVLGGIYQPVERQLAETLRLRNQSTQREDLKTMLAIRQHNATYVLRYRHLIGRAFDDFRNRGVTTGDGQPLGLIDEGELASHLAGQRLADAIARRYQKPIELLERRLDALSQALGMPAPVNPVGPGQLATAFVKTYLDAGISETLQPLMFHFYEEELSKVLGELYQRINSRLAIHGYLAERRGSTSEILQPVQNPAAEVRAEEALASLHGANNGDDQREVQQLRELMHHWRAANDDAPLHPDASAGSTRSQQDAGVPEALSHGAVPTTARSPAPGSFRGARGLFDNVAMHPVTGGDLARGVGSDLSDDSGAAIAPNAAVGVNSGSSACSLQDRVSGAAAGADTNHSTDGGSRRSGAEGSGSAPRGGPRLQAAELASVAMLIQCDDHPQISNALARGASLRVALRQCLMEGTRRFGLDPDTMHIGEEVEDVIDLVGLIFESLISSEGLTEEGKRLLARLMVLYTRVGLGDFQLFVRSDHPARRFVDAVTLSCEDSDTQTAQDSDLLKQASAAVDYVIIEYNEDLAIFETATRELHDLLEQHRRRAEIVERRSTETVNGRERLLQARLQAASALAQRVSRVPLSATVYDFLEQKWMHHLVQVILRDGFGSERHAEALALADDLVSIDQLAARFERDAVVSKVVAIRPRLVECLSTLGVDDHGAREWMASLARAVAFEDDSRVARDLPLVPQLPDDSDDTRLLEVVGGHGSLDFDPVVADQMRALQPGSWLRLTEVQGNDACVKVAWISPLTSRLLLVNRRGLRKLVASPEELAALVGLGRVSVEDDHLPFDEALHQVLHRLGDAAAIAA